MKHLRITVEGKTYDVEVEFLDEGAAPAPQQASAPIPKPVTSGGSDVVCPLAAVVVSIDVAAGATVTEGQQVVTLEAMKMNTIVSAPVSGTISAINVAVGESVAEGQSLLSIS